MLHHHGWRPGSPAHDVDALNESILRWLDQARIMSSEGSLCALAPFSWLRSWQTSWIRKVR
jgi:hypothetical protein